MTSSRSSGFAALAMLVLLSLAPTVAAQAYAHLRQGYRSYVSPFLEPLPAQQAPPTYPSRVVVVWVRGLSLEASQRAPALNALRQRGASIIVEPLPPIWRPSVVLTLLSGASPAVHGALDPDAGVDGRLDTIFHRLRAAERPAALIVDPQWAAWFEDLVPSFEAIEASALAVRDDRAVERALELLRPPARFAFVLVELELPEAIATADPEVYALAVAATEVRIQAIVQALDPATDALVILGEPGAAQARDARAPMILVGPGVLPNTAHIARATDVAPTLAVLAGAGSPAHAQGAPIFQALAPNPAAMVLTARQLTLFYEAWSERMGSPRFAAVLLREREAAFADANQQAFTVWQAQLNNAAQRQAEQRLTVERLTRLPLAIGAVLFWVIVCAAVLRSRGAWVAWIGAGLAAVVWGALVAPSVPFDLKAFEQPLAWAEQLGVSAQVSFVVLGALVALIGQRESSPADVAGAVLGSLGLFAGVALAALAVLFVLWGDVWAWMPPEPAALGDAWRWLALLRAFNLSVGGGLPELPLVPILTAGAFILRAALAKPARR